jgi:Protein of unknown function (DUF4054)
MAQRDATSADLPAEFSSVDAAIVAMALREAQLQVATTAWGEATSEGQTLLASHILKMQGLGSDTSAQGPVRSRRVGDVSEDYAVVSPASVLGDELGSTHYGRRFRALRRTMVRPGWWAR